VKDFLSDWMEKHRNSSDVPAWEREFRVVVDALSESVPGPLLRSNTSVTPQNELEAVMVAAAGVLETHGSLGTPPSGWLDDHELVAASTGGTNTRSKFKARIDRATALLAPEHAE
jgi:hypothetical protein